MSKTWLVSDTHFGHANICKFTRKDGSWLRPWREIEDHDLALIDNWNSVVKPKDKVYHLGDVGFRNATYTGRVLAALNGTKVLIKGNHDTLKLNTYKEYFKDVRAYHVLNGVLLAHIPVHPSCLGRWKGQVHGHLHANSLNDPLYYNVSMEQINYTPIAWDDVNDYFNSLPDRVKSDEYGAD